MGLLDVLLKSLHFIQIILVGQATSLQHQKYECFVIISHLS